MNYCKRMMQDRGLRNAMNSASGKIQGDLKNPHHPSILRDYELPALLKSFRGNIRMCIFKLRLLSAIK